MPTLMKSRAEDNENGVGMKKLEQQAEVFGRVPSVSVAISAPGSWAMNAAKDWHHPPKSARGAQNM